MGASKGIGAPGKPSGGGSGIALLVSGGGGVGAAAEGLPEEEVHAALAQEGLQVEVVESEEVVEVMALAAKPKEVGAVATGGPFIGSGGEGMF